MRSNRDRSGPAGGVYPFMMTSRLGVSRCRLASGIFVRGLPVVSLAAALFVAGCASPGASVPTATGAAEPVATAVAPELRKGMSGADLKVSWGEPKEVRPFVVDGVTSEVWVFERRIPGKTRQVVVRMQEVPYVDPITGVMRMIQEPVNENETTTVIETTEVLMFSGVVAEWKKSFDSERAFH